MDNKRVVTITINADGKEVRETTQDVQKLNNGLQELDVKQAREVQSTLKSVGSTVQSVGSSIKSLGQTLTVAVSLPLVGLATMASKSALSLDEVRTKFIAIEGSTEAANLRIIRLQKLSSESIGVMQKGAFEAYSQLKGLGGVTDETIEKIIKGVGRLNAGFKIEDQQGFFQNLTQIFNQDFERADIKEAIGRVPIFEQLMEQAFGTKDAAKLKELKASGKLTMDTFMSGLSDAIENDSRLKGLQENLSTKIAKGWEKLDVALAPLGEKILSFLEPAFAQIVPLVEQASSYFANLSPEVQTLVVTIGALVAGLGPALAIIGSVVVVIGSIISAFGAIAGAAGIIGTALLVVAGVFIQIGIPLAALGAIAYSVYQAWQTNFGGIQEIVAEFQQNLTEVLNAIVPIVKQAIDEISSYANDGFNQIKTWWEENGQDIEKAVGQVFTWISQFIKLNLSNIAQFWKLYGDVIISTATEVWNVVKAVVGNGISVIANTIKLISAVINGDWAKAWQAFKSILLTAQSASLSILKSLMTMILNLFKGIAITVYEIGKNIVQGLINGIRSKVDEAYNSAKTLVTGVIDVLKYVPKVQSPSRVTTEIGQFIGEGLALGIENKVERTKSAAKKIVDETIKILKDALTEFQKVSSLSSDQINRQNLADDYQEAANNLKEIIKLRKELKVDEGQPLPNNIADTNAYLKTLQYKKDNPNDAVSILEKTKESSDALADSFRESQLRFEDYTESIRQKGEISVLKLQEEIELIGVTDNLEKIRIQNNFDLKQLREDLSNDGWLDAEIDDIIELTQLEQGRLLELQKISQIRKEISSANDFSKDLSERLSSLQNGGRELSEYEKTLRKLNEDFKNISPEQKQQILNTAAQVDAQKQFNEEYQKTYDFVRGALDILTEKGTSFGEKMKSIFSKIVDNFKNMVLDMASTWLSSKLMGGNGGNQSGGFSLGNLFGGLFGGNNSSAGTPYRTPSFNPNASNFAGATSPGGTDISSLAKTVTESLTHERLNTIGGDLGRSSATAGAHELGHSAISTAVSSATGAGGMNWGNLSKSFGQMAPMLGMGLGAGLGGNSMGGQILGSLGGLAGGLAVGIGTGAIGGAGTAMGGLVAALGGTMMATGVLAAVAVPLLIGAWLLGRNKQRRADETTRNSAMLDAFAQLDEIKKQIERDRMDGQSGIANANSIRSQYMQQMSQLKDSKTRNIALKDVSRIDSKIDLIKQAADAQDKRKNIDEQWVPVYASGTYMDAGFARQYGDFKRRNGMLGGSWTGRDYLPSLLADAEMVLNPMQQERIKNAAGFDVFAGAGIPNYKAKAPTMPKFAEGVNLNYSIPSPSSSANSQQNNQPIMISVESVTIDANGIVFEGLKSSTNQKVIFSGQKKIIKNGQG